MNGFEKRKQEKMQDILDSAFDLFRKEGIDEAKITDIAKKANVSKVSIYNYFGSKEELARQVMFNYMDKKAEELKRLMCSELSFIEKFDRMVNVEASSVNELTNESNEGLINNNMILSPQVQQFLQEYEETRIKPLFLKFIAQGKMEGSIDDNIETETIFMYIQAINGILSSPITLKQRMDLGKLLFYGLRGK